ncbi:TPA: glycosyltransferase [Pseudomonas aeruginosa]|nr:MULTISPECIES: glycosyltransferase [Pseudomonas aeruginosa group]ERV78889.1 hypothetical protein Q040_05738 [Pseudomonas aeruginosa BWHPSA027]ERX29933.1 hypothetical protein Q010_05039 [Pseudomonas aeruginosa 19660]EZO62369.1 hypothetical protein V559_00270 [Pseudomonas aeruginosa BWH058]ARH13547.1 hypothetical protein HW04_30105 [Pseudomonas aeruginosa]EOT10759.1 hypothetical protein CIA_04809 [Pseudomonas aeruginosa PA14]
MNSCLHGSVRYVSYWENPPGQVMPAYVALALVSMRRALGERFLLLTPGTVLDLIDPRILGKAWAFEPLPFTLAKGIEAIVAKSDFIRMAFVHRHGGAWVDADTLFLRDPTSALFPAGLSHKLHWHSECIFASQPGNPLLARALATGLEGGAHCWGNPGRIKDIVAQSADELVPIAGDVVDPGYRPRYNFASCEVMRRQDVSVADFLVTDATMLKLYNTYFRRTARRMESVEEFLSGGTLLAKLFLHIEADPGYWLGESERLIEAVC